MDESMNIDLQSELIADLTLELQDENTFNLSVLTKKVVNAIREVKRARKYPSHYSDSQIKADLYEYYSNIRNIALYDYNQIGAEFENSHNENGVNRSYMDRNKLFWGIVPFAKI